MIFEIGLGAPHFQVIVEKHAENQNRQSLVAEVRKVSGSNLDRMGVNGIKREYKIAEKNG